MSSESSSIKVGDTAFVLPAKIPEHIAVVMDGNGRWAKKNNLSTSAGHKAGAEAMRSISEACREFGVRHLTLFAFSSENWQRPALEVRALMTLFSSYLDSEIRGLHDKGVRIRFIGRRDRFSKGLLKKLNAAEALTMNNSDFHLTLAVDYGGLWDISQAAQKVAQMALDGKIQVAEINEESLSPFISLSDLPKPDLMIRTSGEHRISNFLLWQLAYSELYFTDTLWPDFDESALLDAIDDFASRQRRFGMTGEQVKETNHA